MLNFLSKLIAIPSISPLDLGCQKIISQKLQSIGFKIEFFNFNNTSNLWATRGKKGKTLVFLGHTDVVSPGDVKKWKYNPFSLSIHKNYLFGRGVADMKGALSAMILAIEELLKKKIICMNRIAFLITSDEESSGKDGIKKVIKRLKERGEKIDYCLVGEPTSVKKIGDTIKNGRRGSLTASLLIKGVQGHVAYPNLAYNPIHNSIEFIKHLVFTQWDKENKFFSPTSLQIFDIKSSFLGDNVIPDKLFLKFNFRFGIATSQKSIIKKVNQLLNQFGINYEISWNLLGNPYLTKSGFLLKTIISEIKKNFHIAPLVSTDGGTSDGRWIFKEMKAEVVELGLVNKTIHKLNERIKIKDLNMLALVYKDIVKKFLLSSQL